MFGWPGGYSRDQPPAVFAVTPQLQRNRRKRGNSGATSAAAAAGGERQKPIAKPGVNARANNGGGAATPLFAGIRAPNANQKVPSARATAKKSGLANLLSLQKHAAASNVAYGRGNSMALFLAQPASVTPLHHNAHQYRQQQQQLGALAYGGVPPPPPPKRRLPRFADSKIVRKGGAEIVEEYYQDGKLVRTVRKAQPKPLQPAALSVASGNDNGSSPPLAGTGSGGGGPLGYDSANTNSSMPCVLASTARGGFSGGSFACPPPPPPPPNDLLTPPPVAECCPPAPPPPAPAVPVPALFPIGSGSSASGSAPLSNPTNINTSGSGDSVHFGARVFVPNSPLSPP